MPDPSKTARMNTAIADSKRVSRFLRKVDQGDPDDCWPWLAATAESGHGRFSIAPGDLVNAHRFAWALANGPIPDDVVVRHRCDNPPCCNPGHLELGTQLDNIADMHRRGRASGGRVPRPGDLNPNAKVTDQQALAMRALRDAGASVRAIAADFGISPAQVSRITRGLRRSHLDALTKVKHPC